MALDLSQGWWRKPIPIIPTNTGRSMRSTTGHYAMRTNGAQAATDGRYCTISVWIRPTQTGAAITNILSASGTRIDILMQYTDNTLGHYYGGVGVTQRPWPMCFDPSEWLHLVLQLDNTQATAANRLKWFYNSIEQTNKALGSAQGNQVAPWTEPGKKVGIGVYAFSPGTYQWGGGYIHYPVCVDGRLVDPSEFGYLDSVTGKWMPKQYLGSVGAQGFIVDFSDDANLGKDISGGIDFTLTGLVPADIYTDKPQLCYPLLALEGDLLSAAPTYGDERLSQSGVSTDFACVATHVLTQGRWYWECTAAVAQAANATCRIGICEARPGKTKQCALLANGQYIDATGAAGAYAAAWSAGETIGVDLDLTVSPGTIRFYQGGAWGPTRNLDTTVPAWQPLFRTQGSTTQRLTANFGARALGAMKPVGTLDVCSANITPPLKASDYFGVLQWTGTGAAQNIRGLSFTPDMVWIKHRAAAESMMVFNSARGATKYLLTQSTAGEATDAQSLTAFQAGGFDVGTSLLTNKSGDAYVAYCWKKGATPGFDIVSYNGDGGAAHDIAHALGVAPSVILIKRLDATAAPWTVFDANLATQTYLLLNTTGAVVTDATVFPTTPGAATFRVGTNVAVNAAGVPYIALVFAEKPGLSRFDGTASMATTAVPAIMTGFRPGLVIQKSQAAGGWNVWDNVRAAVNGAQMINLTNTAAVEASDANVASLAGGQQGTTTTNTGARLIWSWGAKAHARTRVPIPGN